MRYESSKGALGLTTKTFVVHSRNFSIIQLLVEAVAPLNRISEHRATELPCRRVRIFDSGGTKELHGHAK